MKKQNAKNGRNFAEIEPPKGLREAIFAKIENEKQRKLATKKMVFRLSFTISGIFSVAAIYIFGKEILSSEFLSLLSLSFSDIQTVPALWQDYTMSLLETFPTVAVAATLLPIFVSLLLLQQYARLEQIGGSYSFKH